MNPNVIKTSLGVKKTIIFSLLFALPIIILGQYQSDNHRLRAETFEATRTFTKESVTTPIVYDNSGYLLCDGATNTEQFRFFYYSAAGQDFDDYLVILKADYENMTLGTLMNMSVFNGLTTIRVTFSGGDLYAQAKPSLFENYDDVLYSTSLISGVAVDLNPDLADYGYVTIVTDSADPVTIESIEICYVCDHEVDSKFYYDDNNESLYARSVYSWVHQEHDMVMLATNPTTTTNNYSQGEYAGHPNKWYRWNGLAMQNYRDDLGIPNWNATPFGALVHDEIIIQMTAFIDSAIFYDEDALFNIGPWINVGDESHNEVGWIQSYMGSDNYDPLGGVNTERTDTYRGRFFTNYAEHTTYTWGFQDPDATTVVGDAETTLREAFEAYNLPFFNIVFHIQGNAYTLFINGFEVYHEPNYFYEVYTDQQYSIKQIHFQAVNYGDDNPLGNPLSPYYYGFTNPTVVAPGYGN